MRADLKRNALVILTCFFAVALQIQVTFFSSQDYIGLRLNLGDLLLPFVGVGILLSLWYRRSLWPKWSVRYMYFVLAGLIAVMSVALLQGYLTNGFLSSWALINKYTGFLILLSYLALGGWIATNERSEKIHPAFVKYLCGFCIAVLVASLLAILLEAIFPVSLWIGDYSWDGFMANRNAFMLVTIFTMILMEVYRGNQTVIFPAWVFALFWTLIPFFMYFNTSRTAWLIGSAILLITFLIRPLISLKSIAPFLVLGGLLCFSLWHVIDLKQYRAVNQFSRVSALLSNETVSYQGDKKRFIAVEDGLELYNQYNHILGGGLGSYREFQIEKRGEFVDLIDFTALWLLVETGGLGLFSFTAFFLLCLWVFYKRGFGEEASPFHRSLFFFLIAFACISVLHEVMYTRFLWFAMGLGLAQGSIALRKNP